MRVLEGMPLIKIPPMSACPEQTVVILGVYDGRLERDHREHYPNDLCRWVYGPGTESPWPDGDYYAGDVYIEPAFQSYDDFAHHHRAGEWYLIDPDLTVDTGL